MRVITGSARGMALKAPKGMDTRPTMDQVKEGIFSAIQFEVEGRRVLDLFAGSGQMGIEALSRGAKSAVFVDSRDDACKVVRENLSKDTAGRNWKSRPFGLPFVSSFLPRNVRSDLFGPALRGSFPGK